MTVRDILEGYGIDFDSLTFKMTDYPDDPHGYLELYTE